METREERVDLVTLVQCLLAQACEYYSTTVTTVLNLLQYCWSLY